jgi:hypothetical protein
MVSLNPWKFPGQDLQHSPLEQDDFRISHGFSPKQLYALRVLAAATHPMCLSDFNRWWHALYFFFAPCSPGLSYLHDSTILAQRCG